MAASARGSARGSADGRGSEVTELDFDDDRRDPRERAYADEISADDLSDVDADEIRTIREDRHTDGSSDLSDGVSLDDLAPETLIDEDAPESLLHPDERASDTELRVIANEASDFEDPDAVDDGAPIPPAVRTARRR